MTLSRHSTTAKRQWQLSLTLLRNYFRQPKGLDQCVQERGWEEAKMQTQRGPESESIAAKIRRLITELSRDLTSVERQEKLNIVSRAEAESIRKSIEQSIAELRTIPGSNEDQQQGQLERKHERTSPIKSAK